MAYLLFKRLPPRYAILSVLVVGCGLATSMGQLDTGALVIEMAVPLWTTPQWSWHAIVNIGLPLALVSLAGQSVPGIAVLRRAGYSRPHTAHTGASTQERLGEER